MPEEYEPLWDLLWVALLSVSAWSDGSRPSCCDADSSAPQLSTLCHSCGCPYVILCPFFSAFLPGSCWSASSSLYSCDAPGDGLLQVVVSDIRGRNTSFFSPSFVLEALTFCSFVQELSRYSLVLSPWHTEQRPLGSHFKRFQFLLHLL